MRIISERELVQSEEHRHEYHLVGRPTCAFAFDVDEHGETIVTDANRENLAQCQAGVSDDGQAIVDDGICVYPYEHWVPAVGLCDCGGEVYLDGFTNTCECGADYNSSGQRLAPREQWGEETGEHPADILRIR